MAGGLAAKAMSGGDSYPSSFQYPGMGTDLKIAGDARQQILSLLGQLGDDPSGSVDQRAAQIAGVMRPQVEETFSGYRGREKERSRALGLDRSSFQAISQGKLAGRESMAMAEIPAYSYDKALSQQLRIDNALRSQIGTLMGLTEPAMQIGMQNMALQQQGAQRSQEGAGLMGQLFGGGITGYLSADELGMNPWAAALAGAFNPGGLELLASTGDGAEK